MLNNKKALTYVDWTISFGVFIVGLTILFVFLRPGAQVDHSPETLFKIIEDGFESTSTWTVKKMPIFIRRLDDVVPGPPPTNLKLEINITDWTFGGFENPNPSVLSVTLQPTKVVIDCTVTSCANKVIYLAYHPTTSSTDFPKLKLTCNPAAPSICNAELGTAEDTHGIKLPVSFTYTAVKSAWHFPSQRDFSINVTGIFQVGPEPPIQSNIFVKEIKTRTVAQDGKTTSALMRISIW